MKLNRSFLRLMNLYPPYLGAGIRISKIAGDLRSFEVSMRLRFWNRNFMGTHFGASLYAMVDPFYCLLLIAHLSPDQRRYTAWDKEARIRFRRPGRGRVHARFEISDETLERVRAEVAADGKSEPQFLVRILDEEGKLVAEIEKTVHVALTRERSSLKREAPAPQ
jgi:acyl-coenzyme A thioesterase PaaI-like protein